MDSAPFDRVARLIDPRSRLAWAWALAGGISAGMTALEIEVGDGSLQRVIVRQPGAGALTQNPRAAQDEFRVLEITHAHGLPTPRPLLLDDSRAILPAPYLVMEYLDGRMEFAPPNAPEAARQMAAALAQIHALDGDDPRLDFLPRTADDYAAAVGAPPAVLNESMQEGRIRAALEAAWPISLSGPSALLHGDFWPGNVLWQGSHLVGVVDWEDAALGDALRDLAISRLDLLWIYGEAAMEEFTRAYLSLRALDLRSLPAWDLFAALRLVRLAGADLPGWAAFFAPYGRVDITEESIRKYYEGFVGKAIEGMG